eukprot:NODE_191_length_15469_cov_0.243071.p8 type:complete len:153 gc:universal NODE_191_length_15469_cov_0.243071:14298-14756(+)
MSDHEFESVDSGASKTYPQQASALRKGGFVVIKGRACKIVDLSTSKTGKHGHAKIHITAVDIFNGKKCEDLTPSTANMDVPHVTRNEYTLIDIDDGFLSLMDSNGETKDDIKVPEEDLGKSLVTDFEDGKDILVTVISAMGEEAVVSFKNAV